MAQDILLAALIRSRHFDPALASWRTFIDLIARHAVADRIRTDRRACQAQGVVAMLSPAHPVEAEAMSAAAVGLGLRGALELLPEAPQQTCSLAVLAEGDIAAAQRASGRSSSAFYRDLAELRLWLRAIGLAPPRRCAGKNPGLGR
jgi:DNA-directed RNA polymerase specialized sigma24 family protein